MWLSRQMKPIPADADAELGVTTIAGGSAGVVTRGEARELPVFAPGGYFWQPENGDTVLVIRGGPGGEERCVAAARQKNAPAGMQPGEICLRAPGGASVLLHRDGTMELCGVGITLRGAVTVTGSLTVNGHACNAGAELTGGTA